MELVIRRPGQDPHAIPVDSLAMASLAWLAARKILEIREPSDVTSVTVRHDLERIGSVSWGGSIYSVVDHHAGFPSSDAELLYDPAA